MPTARSGGQLPTAVAKPVPCHSTQMLMSAWRSQKGKLSRQRAHAACIAGFRSLQKRRAWQLQQRQPSPASAATAYTSACALISKATAPVVEARCRLQAVHLMEGHRSARLASQPSTAHSRQADDARRLGQMYPIAAERAGCATPAVGASSASVGAV